MLHLFSQISSHGRLALRLLILAFTLVPLLSSCGSKRAQLLLTESAEVEPTLDDQSADPTPTQVPTPTPQPPLYVDVCGAVLHPGVYILPAGARVYTAIDAAGGFTADAATTYLNQALPLTDGQQVYVPSTVDVVSGAGDASHSTRFPGLGGADAIEDGRININTAGEAELTQISGIGPSKAKAIIVFRETNGPFETTEDICKVPGIGEGIYAKIQEQIRIE